MADIKKAKLFFQEVLDCFKLDSFKVMASMDMLVILHDDWFNYLLETKEFGMLKELDGFDFFVCLTSKSGIAFKGELSEKELKQLKRFEDLYHSFLHLDMDSQGDVLKKFFPEEV